MHNQAVNVSVNGQVFNNSEDGYRQAKPSGLKSEGHNKDNIDNCRKCPYIVPFQAEVGVDFKKVLHLVFPLSHLLTYYNIFKVKSQ